MNVKLPTLIENLVQASNERDAEAFASCFTTTATVEDDGDSETLKGREAISEWFERTMKNYNYDTEPVALKESGDQIIMMAKATGTFPGSPLNFDYHINLKSGLIQNLRIGLTK